MKNWLVDSEEVGYFFVQRDTKEEAEEFCRSKEIKKEFGICVVFPEPFTDLYAEILGYDTF